MAGARRQGLGDVESQLPAAGAANENDLVLWASVNGAHKPFAAVEHGLADRVVGLEVVPDRVNHHSGIRLHLAHGYLAAGQVLTIGLADLETTAVDVHHKDRLRRNFKSGSFVNPQADRIVAERDIVNVPEISKFLLLEEFLVELPTLSGVLSLSLVQVGVLGWDGVVIFPLRPLGIHGRCLSQEFQLSLRDSGVGRGGYVWIDHCSDGGWVQGWRFEWEIAFLYDPGRLEFLVLVAPGGFQDHVLVVDLR